MRTASDRSTRSRCSRAMVGSLIDRVKKLAGLVCPVRSCSSALRCVHPAAQTPEDAALIRVSYTHVSPRTCGKISSSICSHRANFIFLPVLPTRGKWTPSPPRAKEAIAGGKKMRARGGDRTHDH